MTIDDRLDDIELEVRHIRERIDILLVAKGIDPVLLTAKEEPK